MPAYKYILKDGKTVRWYANFYYTDWSGKKKHVCKRGFLTQREAKEYERNYQDKQSGCTDMLFSSLVEIYLEDMKLRVRPTTFYSKGKVVERWILPYFKDIKVCDIDPASIRKWQNEIMGLRTGSGSPLKPTTLKLISNQMSSVMNYAVVNYGLAKNPSRVAGSIGKSKAPEMQIWTREEFENAIRYETNSTYRLIYTLLFYTGIREGEMFALTADDVLPDMTLNIKKNHARIHKTDYIMQTKTDRGMRNVALPEFLYKGLTEYIDGIYGIKKSDTLFSVSRQNLLVRLRKLAEAAKLNVITVHDLRHSHASMLIDMNVDIVEISRRLGHESVRTTIDIYGHLYPTKDKDTAKLLNDAKITDGI